MSIYTKNGDAGVTSLLNEESVSKADDRIELIGLIDELSSYIGFAKVKADCELKNKLSVIQKDLITVMASIADLSSQKYYINEERVLEIENEIDEIEKSFPREKGFVLYGGCELSARLDLARAATRKSERYMVKINTKYKINCFIMKYMNRLSDYFYILARYEDYKIVNRNQ